MFVFSRFAVILPVGRSETPGHTGPGLCGLPLYITQTSRKAS